MGLKTNTSVCRYITFLGVFCCCDPIDFNFDIRANCLDMNIIPILWINSFFNQFFISDFIDDDRKDIRSWISRRIRPFSSTSLQANLH